MVVQTSTRWGQKVRRVIAGIAVISLVVAACGSDDDGNGTASPTTAASEVTTTAASDDTVEAASPSGTLRVGVPTNVQSFDPHLAAVAQEYYLHPLYDTLVRAEADGSYSGGLAESWNFPERTVLVLTIREGVTFSDGTPVDAKAVAANLERGKTVEASPSRAFFANIMSVEMEEPSTVRIKLSRPSTSILSDFSRLPGMMMSPASFEDDPSTRPVGAGGWVLDRDASNAGEVQVFVARADYWDPGRIGVERVEMRLLEPVAAVNALLGGQVDIIEAPLADRDDIEARGYELVVRANTNVNYIQMMDTDGSLIPALGDKRVRTAMNLAIDREAYSTSQQFGRGVPTPSFWLPGTPYYDESLEQYAFDLPRAQSLLAEAGYGDGFAITLHTFGGLTAVAESVQQMWTALGLDVKVELVEPGTLAAVMRNGTTALTPTVARGHTAESHYLERMSPGGPYDPIGTERGRYAELADKAFQSETLEEQNDAWREVYRYAIEQGFLMVISHSVPAVGVAPNIEGVVMLPSDNIPQPYGVRLSD